MGGLEAQILQVAEECSELTKELYFGDEIFKIKDKK